MTDNEYLDMMKKYHHIIYKCDSCDFRGFGVSKTLHESEFRTHTCYNEDSISIQDLYS